MYNYVAKKTEVRRVKKRKRVWRVVLIGLVVVVLLAAAVFGINAVVCAKARPLIVSPDDAPCADCIVVLGAGVRDDGSPSPMLADRLDYGIALYKSGAADYLLMSGDHGQVGYDEVNVMKQYAIDAGVPSEAIFMDHAGFSTYESMYRAKEIFKLESVIVVTQEYHLYRALYIADQLGIKAHGVASDPRRYVGETVRTVREILARDKDFFKVMFRSQPTYLGDAIPVVGGNGDVTNDS